MTDLEPKDFDSNVWYHLTEQRVDDYDKKEFGAQFAENSSGDLQVAGIEDQYWQFQPVDDKEGRYALRCSKTGVLKQLSVCYNKDEIANTKTQPCLADSNGNDEQKWDVADWGNNTFRFVNVKNGTDYVLDVHPGNPPFLSDDLRTNIPQPAQHWLATSVKNVDDGAYSTVFAERKTEDTSTKTTITSGGSVRTVFGNDPTSTAASSSSESDSDSGSSGLSAGAAAGIGIGVGLGVIALALLAFLFWWKRRNRRSIASTGGPPVELAPSSHEKSPYSSPTAVPVSAVPPPSSHTQTTSQSPPPVAAAAPAPPPAVWPPQQYRNHSSSQEMSTERPTREAPGQFSSELDSMPVGSSQKATSDS